MGDEMKSETKQAEAATERSAPTPAPAPEPQPRLARSGRPAAAGVTVIADDSHVEVEALCTVVINGPAARRLKRPAWREAALEVTASRVKRHGGTFGDEQRAALAAKFLRQTAPGEKRGAKVFRGEVLSMPATDAAGLGLRALADDFTREDAMNAGERLVIRGARG